MDDYYKGFEGNPEIDFYTYKDNGEKIGLEIWEGYFNEIMQEIKPVNGKWRSLAYYYHLYEGWYDESPWEIPNNKEALELLETVETSQLDVIPQEILLKLIKLLKENINNTIYIEYD
ncbi:dihydroorotate dehydrogenase (quinone) [Listeria sp. FSL L7-1485]|uniref:Dihydroorotate dehydrogenase (Quinone) n=1 Tax=Listeria immobilis TaxID=2713502 RepID=A0A7X0X4R1_9LIST|nr:dihydroorotate dehydrogenase (quinone) [Listeria immobilis]MBC1487495.1 dihydroorotate dehydrogenase (quinone) [Listeria immobilis]MBC1506804.1 dihydroorotate dehydrogenase (quinone) [Listeria immobilis]MBC1509677.1 dihydroorotate dehydrogenase (quinone) [Listeria immobilis]MBC1515423.1 dihydroorotate dehydrogenase (quinone) [Listeria immobilis]MBC1534746.1 dihydroorotate dehydrogenase (quinone) [Listeria immobilis]